MPRDPNVGVGTAVVYLRSTDRGWGPPEVLLGYRQGCTLSETWAIPGGWLEDGEQPATGVAREIAEEAGMYLYPILPFNMQELGTFAHRAPDGAWVITVAFTAFHDDKRGEPREMDGERLPDGRYKIGHWTWYALDRLPANLTPFTRDALKKYTGELYWAEPTEEVHPEGAVSEKDHPAHEERGL